jgi:hypothetical protein
LNDDDMPARCWMYGHAWTVPDAEGRCACKECGTPMRFRLDGDSGLLREIIGEGTDGER